MKQFKIMGVLFTLIGFASLIGALASITSTKSFIAQSKITTGEIVDIVTKTRRDSDGNRTHSRHSVIQFEDEEGASIEFESSFSTDRGIRIGEPVEVRYAPDNPQNARVSGSFMDMWGLAVFLSIFGVAFAGPGSLLFWFGIRDDIAEKKAMTYSKEVSAQIKDVFQNTAISMNGRSPFVIEAQWLNPDTHDIHVFTSKNLWYNPSEYLKDEVTVKMDPRNQKKYWMDISFLPKKA
ncbi:MAG: DUF3592 domain-containing protein [Fibrobacterota bacterium]